MKWVLLKQGDLTVSGTQLPRWRAHPVPAPGFLTGAVVRTQDPSSAQLTRREARPSPSSSRGDSEAAWGRSLASRPRGGRGAGPQRGRSHACLPPASGRLLGVAAQGVAVGTVLGEEAPGSIGHVGGAPGAAPRLAGLAGRARLRVAVDALLHRHSPGTRPVRAWAEAPA